MTLSRVLPPLLVAYAALSLVLFAMYGFDKAAAKRGGRRIPEASLHLVAVLGGWPGALAARHLFRHKTKKQPFRAVFWCTVILNCIAVASLLTVSL